MTTHTLSKLTRASRESRPVPLFCSCGSDVGLAGEGMDGAVACVFGHVHASLATLVRRKASHR